jgi:Ser/Thr protein kinase RdoA (MazF antagonist)
MTLAFADLSPDRILDAIDGALGSPDFPWGWRCSGQVLPLNSYENRVFQVGLETATDVGQTTPLHRAEGVKGLPQGNAGSVVAKFYRPLRWSDEQILEEHRFLDDLVHAEVPAVPAIRLGGRSLYIAQDVRLTLFARRGGRSPDIGNDVVRERLGRFLGRLHAVGARERFVHRHTLSVQGFGREPARFLSDQDWLPHHLAGVYSGLAEQALDLVDMAFSRLDDLPFLRVHGDCHLGNVLWHDDGSEPGPYFLDFDDALMAPAVQDLWMLLSGTPEEMTSQLRVLLRGYEDFRAFDRRELSLIEPLRTLRLIHHAAWVARRWSDPAFPAAFPWFEDARYWEARILELREQIAAMQEPPLILS